jgi:hypothetical protein
MAGPVITSTPRGSLQSCGFSPRAHVMQNTGRDRPGPLSAPYLTASFRNRSYSRRTVPFP